MEAGAFFLPPVPLAPPGVCLVPSEGAAPAGNQACQLGPGHCPGHCPRPAGEPRKSRGRPESPTQDPQFQTLPTPTHPRTPCGHPQTQLSDQPLLLEAGAPFQPHPGPCGSWSPGSCALVSASHSRSSTSSRAPPPATHLRPAVGTCHRVNNVLAAGP